MNAKLLIVLLLALVAFSFASDAEVEAQIDSLADEIAEIIVAESDSEQNYCVLNWAQQQIGKAYSQANRFGPNSFDCSGLVLKAYEACGVYGLPTYTGAYPGRLRSIPFNQAQPGDIVFRPGHVAIYAGNAQIVHAVGSSHGVKQTPISGWFGTVHAVYRP